MATVYVVTDLTITEIVTPDDCVEELNEVNNPPEDAVVIVTYSTNPS